MIDLRVSPRTDSAQLISEERERAHMGLDAPLAIARRHRELFGALKPEHIRTMLGQALLRGDRETARRIYYAYVIPDRGFSDSEADRLAYRVGAIDEGDRWLALQPD
jgi:hypothetical protein